MNELDAKAAGFARRVNFNFISIEPNGAGVSLDHSAEDLHQRRFSGSVLANQRHNFALVDFQIYLFQRDNAGKALADSGHFEKWVGHCLRRKIISICSPLLLGEGPGVRVRSIAKEK